MIRCEFMWSVIKVCLWWGIQYCNSQIGAHGAQSLKYTNGMEQTKEIKATATDLSVCSPQAAVLS